MPFLGYLLAVLLGCRPALAVGLILMGCMPGGTTSNIFTYFSKGALALSIMMTSVLDAGGRGRWCRCAGVLQRLAGVDG
jgi:predicted Na+-dependent transporter